MCMYGAACVLTARDSNRIVVPLNEVDPREERAGAFSGLIIWDAVGGAPIFLGVSTVHKIRSV